MSKEELDNLFKNKLQDHKRIPSANAWDKLEGRLDGEKKPGGFKWWYMAAAIALLLMSGVVIWNVAPEQQLTNSPSTPEAIETEDSLPENSTQKQLAEEKNTEIPEDKSSTVKTDADLKQPPKRNITDQQVAAITPKQPTKELLIIPSEQKNASELPQIKEDVNFEEVQVVASANNTEKAKDQTLKFSIEEFDEALLQETPVTAKTDTTETKKKGLKKLWASVKNGQLIDTNLGELREAKDELLAFNKDDAQKP
jgi:hypothetical protein